ncbi:hypothetical protein Y032_0011g1471 [Ancylostoma ceylanicum]|uniref:Uncharacterized protein n=1 Tax=Ancylostoma ceylanicum TaxID=53326 RepID=A0A016VF66_9BILA|nr:hypothetical protein Y032_0011g1471 [Ancylostoma ceylanicum]
MTAKQYQTTKTVSAYPDSRDVKTPPRPVKVPLLLTRVPRILEYPQTSPAVVAIATIAGCSGDRHDRRRSPHG